MKFVAVALAAILIGCSPSPEEPVADSADRADEIEWVSVIRQDVIETREVQAAVGNGSGITLPIEAEGLVTWAPPIGSTLSSGDVIVEVAKRPVVLVVGDTPLYRPLRLVGQQKGPDVEQLQAHLLDRGFDDNGRLVVDGVFGLSTHRAIIAWQKSVGHPATGVVDSSQLVFLTSEVLLQTELVVGQYFESVEVTGTGTILSVEGSTVIRDFFAVGATVDVGGQPEISGLVTRSARLSNDGAVRQLIEISIADVSPTDLGQSVSVIGSVTRATDVLTIPVRALLAMEDGRWQVEVDGPNGITKVDVELIEVIGTTAIIDGLDENERVLVPR